MRQPKTAYELSRSQVNTPHGLVQTVWGITNKYKSMYPRVLDMGAGDARFAFGGNYGSYDGIEIDKSRIANTKLPANAKVHEMCAFEFEGVNYSLCIGNPPYVRHHDLDEKWRDRIVESLNVELSIRVNKKCNLYIYFLLLGLIKTSEDGVVSMVVPYEWVSRPSALPLRNYILDNKWHVDIYRFSSDIFAPVLTTASISIIDKSNRDGKWNYFDINTDGEISPKPQITNSNKRLLPYENRGELWAMRGMSPGTQKVFTLSEGERIHGGLTYDDVMPCVTTFKHVPNSVSNLSEAVFKKFFIDSGEKCWLIKSHLELTPRLGAYLGSVPPQLKDTWTCRSREIWYKFDLTPAPRVLLSTGFTKYGPKILINDIGAFAVGSICGISGADDRISADSVRSFLANIDFEKRVVAHSGCLKKLEIRQLNAALNRFTTRCCRAYNS